MTSMHSPNPAPPLERTPDEPATRRQAVAQAPLKVLVLVDELAPGGTEKQVIALAESLDRSRFEPTLGVLRTSQYQQTLRLRTPIVAFSGPSLPIVGSMAVWWRLRSYLLRERPAVVITHLVESTLQAAWAIRTCRSRPKLVTTRRNLYWWIDERPFQFRLYRRTAAWTDCIVTNSFRAAEECRRWEDADAAKVKTIQNMIDIELFAGADRSALRSQLGIAENETVVGVMGNWRPVKGLATFLEAAAQVARRFPAIRFILAGDGPQEGDLRRMAHAAGLSSSIHFVKSPQDPSAAIAAFDIAVQPSHSESFSNVLIEYMAAGKPVVATRVGDAERVIDDGDEGLLVEPGDPGMLAEAIGKLLREPDNARAMAERARRKVGRWSQPIVVRQYERLFQELAGGNFDSGEH